MDIEKLVERLRWWAENCDRTNYGCSARVFLLDAATALSTLQAENEKLRAELERSVVLDGKSRDKELIRKLVRLLYWLEGCIKKKDFSPFRIVAGAPENNYPFISAFQHIENEYELEIHLDGKDEEADAALRREQDGGAGFCNQWGKWTLCSDFCSRGE